MAEIVHTPQCLESQRRLAEYDAKWPNACKHCAGTGLVHAPGDFVPYGSTSAQLPGCDEPCRCEEAHQCPRCGAARVWHDDGNPNKDHAGEGWHEPCPQCGFKCIACGFEGDEGRPDHECYCWVEQERREAEEYAKAHENDPPEPCSHGNMPWECPTCLARDDEAYHAQRERQAFGRFR